MPHINRIRVNNVKYNFGTQFYDDFIMRFSGKNTIYDLANGGGKSVLMLLLLQNMIPNCTLDEKQPIEKLFRTGSGSNTIHSLIEWKLNSDDIKNGYKYMTTGFCARKARESNLEETQQRENAAIEYFNYVIFYREFNDNDIKNLPLSNGKERITYHGLKNYLKELEHKDYSLIIKIFERKGEYQQFISQYGIYESEWEIIRGINKTEGHVRTYFETNYKTTRKVVEDLLIEEILQKSYYNTTGEGADFAKLLLDIKNKLVELTKKKNDIANYDRQIEILSSFIARIQSLKGMYHKKGGIEKEFIYAYNTCSESMEKRKSERENVLAKREMLLSEKKEKEAKIDTALVQIEQEELQKLDEGVEKTKEILSALEEELASEQSKLLLKENANDYLDYVHYKKEYEAAKIATEQTSQSGSEVESVLQCIVKLWKELEEAQEKTLQKDMGQLQAACSEKEAEEKNLQETLQKEEAELAFCKSKLHLLKEDSVYELKRLESLKQKTSLLLYEEAQNRVAELEKKLQKLTENRENICQEEKSVEETLAGNRLRLNILKEQEKHVLLRQEKLSEFQKEYSACREKVDKLKEFYQESDERRLKEKIYYTLQNNVLEAEVVRKEIAQLKKNCKAYEKGWLFADTQEMQEALEIINVGKERAITGFSYLNRYEKEKQEELLECAPLLPYSIVVLQDYASVRFDKNLKKIGRLGTVVPIINAKAMEQSLTELYSTDHVDFLMTQKEEFTSEDSAAKALKKAMAELEENQKKAITLRERTELIKSDISYMEEYENKYFAEKSDKVKEYEENKIKLKDIGAETDNLQSQQNDLYLKKDQFQGYLEKQEEELNSVEHELKITKEIKELYSRYHEKERQAAGLRESTLQGEAAVRNYAVQLKALQEEIHTIKEKHQSMEAALKNMKNTWEKEYQQYDKHQTVIIDDSLKKLSMEELEVKFMGLRDSLVVENADIADKKKLAENYKAQMEKCVSAIEYRNGNLEELKAIYERHEMVKSSMEELKQQKITIEESQEKIKVSKKQLEAYAEAANRKFGSIAHGKTLVEEKYGRYQPLDLTGEQLTRFIGEYKNLTQVIDQQIKESVEKEKQLEKELAGLEAMSEDMLRMIESAGIVIEGNEGLLEDETSLKKTYQELRTLYDKIMKEEYERKEAFEKDKNRLKETLLKTQAYELANEVEKHIESPSDETEADTLIANIEDTISCIALEKSSVEQGIVDMEKIKQNFESQCLQTCVNMKAALDRLPKLSGIWLDDKLIPMITLNIPYIKEEMYEAAMSDYIDHIIQTADGFTTEAERVKYIRNQLAWKKLFSVIVKDMNLIKLNLYKRERIKEQSRYLKYEEAVGSTGQSQGIYIQFLVAIIHYITSMNSANADPLKLKNVIFIDNPFGAAKDIYIWEPIFKLLKANNVQLIVPARGATPAITGRFEVNYILGQKLIDGRQQTVVVDYRSQTEQDELEYTSLSFEQNQLQFE